MVITDKFVFIHYPKTGGSFVAEVLKKVHAKRRWFGKRPLCRELMMPNLKRIYGRNVYNPHGTYEQIPEEHKGKPIISCIRNPFDRYVSVYEYRTWVNRRPEELEIILKEYPSLPELTFEEYLSFISVFDIKSRAHNDLLTVDIGTMTYAFLQFFFRDTRQVISGLNETYLNSDDYKKDMPEITFLRNENLNLDLYHSLLNLGYDERDISFVLNEERINVTRRREVRPWQKYYRRDLYSYVRWKDRFIFKLFPEYDETLLQGVSEDGLRWTAG